MPENDLEHPKTNDQILRKVKQMRADGISGSANFFDRMRKAEDFVIGDQWEPGVKEAARAKRKFTLTIPIIKPQIKQIAGSEIQNPQDFIIENTQGGSATLAQILTALTKQSVDSERVRYEKSQTFEAGLGSGQGAMGVFVDKTNDPKHANLRIEKLNEHNTLIDPNCQAYNPNKRKTGAKYVIYEEWVDQEEVHVDYPDKKAELEARGGQTFLEVVAGNIVGIIDWMTGRHTEKETGSFSTRERTDIEVMTKSRYLINHTYWREPKKCVHWFDNRKSEIDSLFLHKDEEIKVARAETKANPDIFSIEEVTSFVMHHTIRSKDTFLEDRVDELNGVQMFAIVFFWPYWVNGYKSGVSEDLIGTQEEINWTHSMALNLVKGIANSGWFIKEDPSGLKAKWLEDHGGEDNIVINKDDFGGEVEKIIQNQFPTFEVFTDKAMNNVKTITGRLDLPETNPKALSGRAKFLDIQKTMQGSMSLLNNWFYTLAILGDLIVDIIRKNDIFSEDEIRAIVDKDDLISEEILNQARGVILNQIQQMGRQIPEQPQQPNPIRLANAPPELQAEMVDKFQEETANYKQFAEEVDQMAIPIAEEILIGMIHNMKSGKYNTKVVVSPMGETMRAIKAIEVFELQEALLKSGDVGLDGDDLIDVTDVPNKEKLKVGRRRKMETLTARSA